MSAPYPLINGVRHSWASVEIKLDDDIILGITEINYKDKLDPGIVKGAGVRPIAFTTGSAEFDGDVTLLLEEFNTMISKFGPAWKTRQFDIIVTYDESGSGLSTIVDTIVGCRITDTEASASSTSVDGSVRKCPFKALDILWNGLSSAPGQPTATS